MMRHTLRAIATFTGSAIKALEKLNRDLVNHARPSPCTAVCVVLRECGDHAEADIICAGHPLPLLVREGRARYVGEYRANPRCLRRRAVRGVHVDYPRGRHARPLQRRRPRHGRSRGALRTGAASAGARGRDRPRRRHRVHEGRACGLSGRRRARRRCARRGRATGRGRPGEARPGKRRDSPVRFLRWMW